MTLQTFTVISTPTTDENLLNEAVERLKAVGEVIVQPSPNNFSEWYQCPALRVPSGKMIFGIEAIRIFVEQGSEFV